MTFVSSVYGLRLQANLAIPGLVACPTAAPVEVQIRLGSAPPWFDESAAAAKQPSYISPYPDEQGQPILSVRQLSHLTEGYFWLGYSDGTKFVVNRSASRIWATWPPAATLADTATYLLGPILGFVLRLRGVTCLHASAIAVGDQAIALLGPAGAGKSMTAAAFAGMGYPVLADDVVALADQGDAFLVQPGYPRLRLWPESVKALYGSAEALPRITPTWDKRHLDLTRNGCRFQPQPLPLAAIYILGERRSDPVAPLVEAVGAGEGLLTLVANTYTNYLLDRAMRAREFELLGRIVENVPLRRVKPHADPAHLSKLCDVIFEDFLVKLKDFSRKAQYGFQGVSRSYRKGTRLKPSCLGSKALRAKNRAF